MNPIRIAGCVLVVVVLGASCGSGSGNAAPRTPTTSQPSGSGPPGSCAKAPGSGAAGGGDVLVAGDIPDSQVYVVYRSTADAYHLNVPEGWAQSTVAGVVSFADKFNSIRVQVGPASSAPSPSSAQSTEVPALAASVPCFAAGKVSTVARQAGTAVLVTYRADSEPDAVTGKAVRLDVERYEFWRAGRLATLTLSSPQGSDNVDPWRKVTDSFTWGL